jgi:hypothetical protein
VKLSDEVEERVQMLQKIDAEKARVYQEHVTSKKTFIASTSSLEQNLKKK